MIRTLATTAFAAACASAALLTSAPAAPRAETWYECIDGWQKNQCVKSGAAIERLRAGRIVFVRPPPPRPQPEVPRYEIHPEGNGSVSGGGGAGGGGGGGGR